MNVIQVRRMQISDAEAVSRLEREIFSMPWSKQGFLDALTGKNTLFLVAEAAGKIVGYCGMYYAMDEGEITNVAVEETCRQQGVGRIMMEQLLAMAEAAGIQKVILEVRVSNEAAIHLYKKLKFDVQGVRRGFYESPREDGYVMIRSQ